MEKWQIERIGRISTQIKESIRHDALPFSFDEISELVRLKTQQASDEEIQAAIDLLCQTVPPFISRADSLPKSKWKWFKYKIVRSPSVKITPFPSVAKTTIDRFKERNRGKGPAICNRCGGPMFKKGRHAKSKKGHTREICDAQMVQGVMES